MPCVLVRDTRFGWLCGKSHNGTVCPPTTPKVTTFLITAITGAYVRLPTTSLLSISDTGSQVAIGGLVTVGGLVIADGQVIVDTRIGYLSKITITDCAGWDIHAASAGDTEDVEDTEDTEDTFLGA